MSPLTTPSPQPIVEILATLTLEPSGVIANINCSSESSLTSVTPQQTINDVFPGLMDTVKTELRPGSGLSQSSVIATLPNTNTSCLIQIQVTDTPATPYLVYVLADHFALNSVQLRQKRLEMINSSLYTSHLDALVTIDGDSIIHEFSPSAEQLFGYTRDEAIGQHVADIVIPPNMHTAHNEGMDRFHVSRTGPVINTRIEIEAIRRNGEIFPCELTVVPTEEYQGTTYFTASIRDITESKAHEAALKKAKEIAEASNEAKSRFLAHMSHEIRSPLNAVIGCMDLLLDSGLTDAQMPLAETSLEAGHGLLGIIEDVLDFSKIEAGQQKITPSTFNLVELCEQVSEVISIRAGTKEINIGCCIDPQIPAELTSDASHIRRILTNLMDNAVKFTEIGGVVLKVSLGDTDPEHQHVDIVFEISDTGIGIPAANQTSLFQEFAQVDNSGTASYGGTGLGLAICRDLAELLGGRINLKSEANSGSTFTVLIPFKTTANNDKGLVQLTRITPVSVLSDNKSFRSTMAQQCQKLGIPCDFIEPGTQAVKSAADTDGHFVIVDTSASQFNIALAELSGAVGFTKRNILLYARPYAPDIIIGAKSNGFQHILQRPLKASSFIQRLNMMSGGTGATRKITARLDNSAEPESNTSQRILLAEDNLANQLVAKTMLSRAGYQIDIANNGLEAIAALGNAEYDLILMDVRMPKLDGISATQEIRKSDASWSTIPIIAMTANAFDTDIERCLANGMNAFLPKPVNRNDLLNTVSKFMNGDNHSHISEQSSSPDGDAVLELNIVNKLIADTSAEAATAIMGMFIQELEKFRTHLASFTDSSELKPLREIAHSCKSSAGYCGAVRFQQWAQKIETSCDLQDRASLTTHLTHCDDVITQTITAINQFLTK
ncbi:response regulator [Zhongshania sp.]|uniref:response regulator n=1 Tax=Zhongshania sp. TaxID=1971902 RepID=UPI003562BC77